METPHVPVTPFLIGQMPRDKYPNAQEFAEDMVKILAISPDLIASPLIPLSDLKGDKGDKGNKGIQGSPGNVGTIGPAGPPGPQGASFTWKGAWALTVTYDDGDLVDHSGTVYVSLTNHLATAATEPGVGVDWATVWATFPIGSILVGTTTNDSAAAGNVGEFIQTLVAVGAPVALTTATPADIASISLTAGDWDVEGNVNFNAAAATVTDLIAGISATSVTLPTDGSQVYSGMQATTTSFKDSITLPRKRISLAAPTAIKLVASATFSAGGIGAFGAINARRVR